MNEADMRDLIDRFIAAYNAFDVDGMLALLSPDVRFENHSGGEVTAATDGIDAFRRLAEQAKSMFSEREQRITALYVVGNTAVAEIDWRGRVAVEVPDGPAAGTAIALKGTSEFHFTDDRIGKLIDRS